MAKILRQNVGGTDYTMAGCALTGVCATSASDYVKLVTLSDGDVISDGMIVAIAFANGNSAGFAPASLTIYSSDQVNYYEDSELTIPFTLAPEGCYDIQYTGTGNAYAYTSFPVLSIGSVSGPVCDSKGYYSGGNIWGAGDTLVVLFTGGKFLILSSSASAVTSTAVCETEGSNPAKQADMDGFSLQDGDTFQITFKKSNSSQTALTLNVSNTGAKPIYINSAASSNTNYTLPAGTYLCRYNGTNYYIDTGYFVSSSRSANTATQADYSRQGAYCTTAAGTAAKVANMRGYTLRSGATFPITFTTSNSSAGALTLNVNSTGAKPIFINNSASSATNYTLNSGTYLCRYNGTNYYIDTGYAVTQARTANSATNATNAGNADTVDDFHVNNQAISTQNDSLNALITIAKKYANATSGTSSVKSGYIQLGNGFKIQWGRTATNTSMEIIDLTLSFTSINSYTVFATREKTSDFSSGGGIDKVPQFYKVSKSQFKLDCPSGSEVRSSWIAIGY